MTTSSNIAFGSAPRNVSEYFASDLSPQGLKKWVADLLASVSPVATDAPEVCDPAWTQQGEITRMRNKREDRAQRGLSLDNQLFHLGQDIESLFFHLKYNVRDGEHDDVRLVLAELWKLSGEALELKARIDAAEAAA